MPIGSLSSAASAGMTSAADRLATYATRTAAGEDDAVAGAGEIASAKLQMAASVAVARTANELMGTLLDIMA
jgi:hypothetical protein